MQVMFLSSAEIARSQAQNLRLRGKELIATGVATNNNGQTEMQVALIDVTPEVKGKQLDTKNLKLVEAFIRRHQGEILDQIQQLATVKTVAASAD